MAEQDRFHFQWTGEQHAVLRAEFATNRVNAQPLVLALPEDCTIEWALKSSRVNMGRGQVVNVSGGLDLSQGLRQTRNWLSDIPLLEVDFPLVERPAFDRTATLPRTSKPKIEAATFDLSFSRPISQGAAGTGEDSGLKDPFGRLGRVLVANPEEIDTLRGIPPERIPPEVTSYKLPQVLEAARTGKPVLKIRVRDEGVFRLSIDRLRGLGFPLSQGPLENLTLVHRGQPYPLGVDQADRKDLSGEGFLWFPHCRTLSNETEEEAYYLYWGEEPGKRLEISETPMDFAILRDWDWNSLSFEEDNNRIYRVTDPPVGLVQVGWKKLGAGQDSRAEVSFDLPDLLGQTSIQAATFPVLVRGWRAEESPEALHLEAVLNGRSVEVTAASSSENLHLSLPASGFRSRGNTLWLNSPDSTPFTIDSVEIVYQAKSASLETDTIFASHFEENTGQTISGNQSVGVRGNPPIGGLEDRWIWVDPTEEGWRADPLGREASSLLVPARESRSKGFVANLDRLPEPLEVSLLASPRGILEATGADVLVVTDSRLLTALEPHLEKRRREGWDVLLATTEEIYDLFSNGVKDRQAIHDFCRWAFFRFDAPRPKFLWLVGETRWDPLGKLGGEVEDLVPSPIMQTEWGLSSNDQLYTHLLGRDDLPDLLVARVSVSTSAELQAYLGKVEEYENPELGWWRATSLLLNDREFPRAHPENLELGLGEIRATRFLDLSEYPMDPIRSFDAVGREGMEARGARQDLVDTWSQGVSMVEYIGHGGVTVWSTRALFKGLDRPDSDVLRLRNQARYPFVVIRSCLSSSVNWPMPPGEVSVAEALIKTPNRGAIAVLGSAGTEFQSDQESYARHLHGALWNQGFRNLGLVRAYAHCQYKLKVPGSGDVADQFLLHGDPLMDLDFPQSLFIHETKWEGDFSNPLLRVGWASGLTQGVGQVRLYEENDLVFESPEFPLNSQEGSLALPVPRQVAVQPGIRLGLYLWDAGTGSDAFGAKPVPSLEFPEGFHLILSSSLEGPIQMVDLAVEPSFAHVGEVLRLGFKAVVESSTRSRVCSVQAILNGIAGTKQIVAFLPEGTGLFTLEVTPMRPGANELCLLFDGADLESTPWKQTFSGIFSAIPPAEIAVIQPLFDPVHPVLGEEVFFSIRILNEEEFPTEIRSIECLLADSQGRPLQDLDPLKSGKGSLPRSLLPGQYQDFIWNLGADLREGTYSLSLNWKTDHSSGIRNYDFEVVSPAHLEVEALEVSQDGPICATGTAIFGAVIFNRGDLASDPMVLRLEEIAGGKVIEASVASIEAGGRSVAPIPIPADGALYDWNIAFRMRPEAITARTEWHPQRMRTDLLATVSVSSSSPSSEGNREWIFETEESLNLLGSRLLHRDRLGFRLEGAYSPEHFQPGELGLPNPFLVQGATQSELASLQERQGWWLTPTTVQAHPNWKGPDLPLVLEAAAGEAIALISPVYKKIDNLLGSAMPLFKLKVGPEVFSVLPTNTHFDLTFEERPVLIPKEGLPLFLEKNLGGWPGFAGVRVRPLPQVVTPLLETGASRNWKVKITGEWLGYRPEKVWVMGRTLDPSGTFSDWFFMEEETFIRGNRLQFRYAVQGPESAEEGFLRSLQVEVMARRENAE